AVAMHLPSGAAAATSTSREPVWAASTARSRQVAVSQIRTTASPRPPGGPPVGVASQLPSGTTATAPTWLNKTAPSRLAGTARFFPVAASQIVTVRVTGLASAGHLVGGGQAGPGAVPVCGGVAGACAAGVTSGSG